MAGSNITISTSKIKKMIVIRKNRKENGKRELELLSKPHSKGDAFSRSLLVLVAKIREILITTITTIKRKGTKINKCIIIFSVKPVLLIGSQIYLYTKKI